MGFKPVKVFLINSTSNMVLSELNPNSQITRNAGEYILLLYDANAMNIYGRAFRQKIVVSTHRVPSCDEWWISYANLKLASIPSVGSAVRFDGTATAITTYYGKGSNAGTYSYDDGLNQSANGYVCYTVSPQANVASSGGYVAGPDQVFTLSDFDLTYQRIDTAYPFSISSSFSGGYKNPAKAFTVDLSSAYYSAIISQYQIAGGTFYYKKTSASSYQTVSFTGSSATVPANTFENGSIYDVYFTAQSTSGASASTDPVTLSTVDGPAVVSPVSPNNEVTYGDITYSWNYSNTTGETQYAFDVQTSPDGTTWTTVLDHVVSSQTRAEYTQTSAGDTYWRVRGYNQNDVAGAWSSEAHYINNVPPQPPVILEIVPGGRISVRWSAENQISYRLEVIDASTGQSVYDSGDVYGTESFALVNTYLPNGNYTIRVKISNIYGKESSWASTNYNQRAELPAFQYSAVYTNNAVSINIASDEFESFYLLRNGELVAHFEETTYTDLFASGETNYKLIAVNSEDNFAQVTFTINASVPFARLITPDGQVLMVSERWDNFNNVEQSENSRYSANEYLGASTPEHLFSKMRVKRFTRAFYDPNRIARQLLGTVAFYADEYGNGDWVAITSYTRADSWLGDDTKIEMEVTTRKEDVTYVV